ncbi:MAG: division/cell wall cluster transcriptional repressor MraZ [Bacteroidota bacterium]|nr:division/cell wall cluster transcriptional repressor MraZ [Bacteroidota bacterium]
MTNLMGEFECRIEAKGRLQLPVALKKQLPVEAQDRFVINCGFENNLVLYPYNEWEIIQKKLSGLNEFKKDDREFIRIFYKGLTEITLDSASRLLIPKRLLDWASIDKEVILSARLNKIEIWDKTKYDSYFDKSSDDYSELAEKVLGSVNLNI